MHRQAAVHANEAGMDGVELHSGNGYLLHQFQDTAANERTDQWGGSKENRCRFTLRIVGELSEVWGADRVGVKLSPGGYNDVGMDKQATMETYSYLLQQLDRLHRAAPTHTRRDRSRP